MGVTRGDKSGGLPPGLRQMSKASEARNRQLDIMAAAQRDQSQVFAEL